MSYGYVAGDLDIRVGNSRKMQLDKVNNPQNNKYNGEYCDFTIDTMVSRALKSYALQIWRSFKMLGILR